MMKTKIAYLVEPRKFEIREENLEIGPEEVLIRIAVCGLCNWELNHWTGKIGDYPQAVGHEWAGTVVEVGKDVKGFRVGDKVTGLAEGLRSFSQYRVSKASDLFLLDEKVKVDQALGEPLKCIMTVVRASRAESGDYGVVIGCGAMGQWCIQALSKSVSQLIAVDVNEDRLHLAKKFGASAIINSAKEDAVKRIWELTRGRMADFVIEGTGIPELMNTACDYLKDSGRGRLVLMSSHERPCKEFDFRKIIDKSIEIIAAHPDYSLDQTDDLRRAVDYLNKGVFQMDELITHRFELDEINQAFETLENKPKDYLKGVVILNQEEE